MVRCVRSSDQQDFSHGYIDQLRLPMLTIPSKQGVTVDLTSVLAELIWTEFGEDPTHFRQEVREFNQLRDNYNIHQQDYLHFCCWFEIAYFLIK